MTAGPNIPSSVAAALKAAGLQALAVLSAPSGVTSYGVLCTNLTGKPCARRIAWVADERVVSLHPDPQTTKKSQLLVPRSGVLLHGHSAVLVNTASFTPTVEALNLKTGVCQTLLQLSEVRVVSLDVNADGRYLLLHWFSDPDFPEIAIYDATVGNFLAHDDDSPGLDATALIDCRVAEVRWGDSTSRLVCRDPDNNVELLLDLDLARRTVVLKPREQSPNDTLWVALQNGKLAAVLTALAAGGDPNASADDRSPLHYAADNGQVDIVGALLDHGADVNHANASGDTALHAAARKNRAAVITLLLSRGAALEKTNVRGNTALHATECYGPQLQALEVLLNGGANPNAQNHDGETPLHLHRNAAAIRLLLTHGAQHSIQDRKGNTPLHCVWSLEAAELLVRHGADPSKKNHAGETPLFSDVLREDAVAFLLSKGAEVNVRRTDGCTPLFVSASTNVLLKHGANPKLANNHGQTPLHVARHYHVKSLHEHGADLDAQDADGQTPLHLAIQAGDVSKANTLIALGAQQTIKNNAGKTAPQLAKAALRKKLVGLVGKDSG